MAQMDKVEFENLVKDTASEAMKGVMEEREKSMVEAIDAKIKEALGEVEKSRVVVGAEGMERDKKAGFKSLSHFAIDVAKAALSDNRKVSKELTKWDDFCVSQKAAGSPSQNVTDGEAGGYLVPPEFRANLLIAAREKNELIGLARPIQMNTQYVEIPYINGFDKSGGLVYGNIEFLWGSEESTYTAKSVKTGKIGLKLNKLTGLAYASDEILKFSPISMEGLLQDGFADGLNFQMNKVILGGTGAGQPLGLLNAPCKVSISKETGQAANTILYENVINMYSRVSDPTNAVWICNPNILPELMKLNMAIGTGGAAVWLPANGAAGSPNQTLMGRPIIFSHHAKTLGTEGDLMFVDMSQYLIGMAAGDDSVEFDSTVYFKFDTGQKTFRWTTYMDGQPWWPTYITPPEATTSTISPVITLAVRA